MYRVMIVDDDKWALKDISESFNFQQNGFQVVSLCENAEEALDAFKRLYPDLLITDIQMNSMNGIRLMEECRKLKQDLITVIISGHSNFTFAREALNGGAFYYMLKPIDEEEAKQVLQKCFAMLSSRNGKQNDDQITKVCAYIAEHLSPSLKLTEIADVFYMNASYLSELFQQRMGISFSQYKKDKMLEIAQSMLRQKNARIADVAEACGFQDVHYFSRWFKEQTKLGPREYKMQIFSGGGKILEGD